MTRFHALLICICAALPWAGAHAADSLALGASMQSGACRDTFTGEAEATQSASLEYRHESEGFSARGYGRVSPSGGNCAEDAFSFDAEVERRFAFGRDGAWYGLARLGAERHATTGVYRHVGDGLVLFANETDGSPAYASIAGAGRCWGRDRGADDPEHPVLCAEAGVNLAPNDYVGHDGAQSGHVGLSYAMDLLGGELEAEVEFEGPSFGTLVTGQRVAWSRAISDRFDLRIGWRRKGGLDEYRSPFDPTLTLDGRAYHLGATDASVSTFEVGISAEL